MKYTNEYISKYRFIYRRIYYAILVVMTVLVLVNGVLLKDDTVDFGLTGFTRIDEEWLDAEGDPFVIAELDSYAQEDSDIISIYYTIPQSDSFENSMIFRTKNVAVSAYLQEELVYETQMQEAPFYNKSAGTRWNVIRLPEEAAGEVLRLDVTRFYTDGRAKVDNFYLGGEGSILLAIIRQKLFALIVSLIILITGGIFLIVYFVMNIRRQEKDRGLLYLGLVAVAVAIWCLLETNLIQLFSKHIQLIQLVDNMMLALGGSLLYVYMDQLYGIFRKLLFRWASTLNLIYLLLATLCQIIGGPDYHQTLYCALVSYGFICVIFTYCIVQEGRKEKPSFDYQMKKIGILFLGLGIMGDLIRFLREDVLDRAALIRMGFLAFLICFGAGNLYHMFQLVMQGYEVEIVSKLAYMDGLTGVGNRTAYLEQKDELIRHDYPWEYIGVVAFDLNNLKQVNDHLGHHAGDQLLTKIADLIQQNFGRQGKVYRTGGDEFMVLLTGTGLEDFYAEAADSFEEQLRQENGSGKYEFEISAAYGVAWTDNVTAEGIMAAEEEADRRMYERKENMKIEKNR